MTTPFLNSLPCLAAALARVRAQRITGVEHIVVDGASGGHAIRRHRPTSTGSP